MKTVAFENYRVVIEPRGLGDLGGVVMGDHNFCSSEADRQQQYRERCDAIRANVQRHVDGIGSVRVIADKVATCTHCGARWTEESPDYNGGCCDKDQEAQNDRIEARQA